MDTLVAQYSRPAYQEEGYSEQEQLELADVAPPLDLKFALPPTAQVSLISSIWPVINLHAQSRHHHGSAQ